jgi:2-oxoglutarate dehydrogenase E1 component
MIQAPIFHVNGDDPEAVVWVARLAFAYRQEFRKDVVIDMICYRRRGHNEADNPSFTQPRMYDLIDAKRSVRKLYTEALIGRGDITLGEAEQALRDYQQELERAFTETRDAAGGRQAPRAEIPPLPDAAAPAGNDRVATAISAETVKRILDTQVNLPEGFTPHPRLAPQLQRRALMIEQDAIDWATGELLALGSVLIDGHAVRLTGQDTRRGTFSQRHAVLVDYATGEEYVPLAHVDTITSDGRSGRFTVLDSLLSEYAAVGFEYGYSLESPGALVAWEAQFGDFVNGAEIVIDNFLVAAEDKWGQRAGLTLLLPHGYEGQGPEHSSARIERFLALGARDNLRLAVPSVAAQYFHLLRDQAIGPERPPLVVITPKSMLRAVVSRSPIEALADGRFAPVLDDSVLTDPSAVRRVVLASGKVAFEAMERRRGRLGVGGTLPGEAIAVVRVEQLYPWPEEEIEGLLSRYANASEVCWLQEEPENMGAWSFVHRWLHRVLRDRYQLIHVSRPESASPATGSAAQHALEQADLLNRAIG